MSAVVIARNRRKTGAISQYSGVIGRYSHWYQMPLSPLVEKLSQREMQMLKGLSEGKTNKETARELGIQEPTVKLHMKTLFRKIGAANRTQAALIAREEGLF